MSSDTELRSILHRLCANSRRRYVLETLGERGTTTVEALTNEVTAWERNRRNGDTDVEVLRQQVAVSLVHAHLPKLDDYGMVEYDSEDGEVVPEFEAEVVPETIQDAFDTVEQPS